MQSRVDLTRRPNRRQRVVCGRELCGRRVEGSDDVMPMEYARVMRTKIEAAGGSAEWRIAHTPQPTVREAAGMRRRETAKELRRRGERRTYWPL